jgi:hypothetical protein
LEVSAIFNKKNRKKAPSKYSKKNKRGPIELVLRKNLVKREAAYMDCKFLKSPMAGEISPPRFKFDRLLHRKHTPAS